mgnify:CR=1 FL=1
MKHNTLNRVRKRKRHDDDSGAEKVVVLGKDKFRIETYLPILDSLSAELNRRVQAYDKIELLFGFLVEFPSKSDDELRLATETFERIILMMSISTFRKKWFILSILQHSWKIVVIQYRHRNRTN